MCIRDRGEAELFEAMAEGGAAGVLAQDEMCMGDSDQRGSHDLVAERVGEHAVLMNSRLVSKSIGAHHCLVRRGLEGDDLAQYLSLIHI